MSWGDVSSAYYSTGIPDIEVYCEAIPALRMMVMANRWAGGLLAAPPGRLWLELQARALPDGPTDAERAGRHGVIVAEVEDASGRRRRGRLRTPEAYGFSCTTRAGLVERVLAGDCGGRGPDARPSLRAGLRDLVPRCSPGGTLIALECTGRSRHGRSGECSGLTGSAYSFIEDGR